LNRFPVVGIFLEGLLEILDGLVSARRAQAAKPLPPEIDDPGVRALLVDEATVGQDSASARRLDRTLLRWLKLRASRASDAVPESAAAVV